MYLYFWVNNEVLEIPEDVWVTHTWEQSMAAYPIDGCDCLIKIPGTGEDFHNWGCYRKTEPCLMKWESWDVGKIAPEFKLALLILGVT